MLVHNKYTHLTGNNYTILRMCFVLKCEIISRCSLRSAYRVNINTNSSKRQSSSRVTMIWSKLYDTSVDAPMRRHKIHIFHISALYHPPLLLLLHHHHTSSVHLYPLNILYTRACTAHTITVHTDYIRDFIRITHTFVTYCNYILFNALRFPRTYYSHFACINNYLLN